jgi:hypothetical protein
VFRWPDAFRTALCALPALPLLATGSPKASLTWSIGCLPLALLGLAPTRRRRLTLIPIGGLFALSIIVGSLLVQTDVTAVVGIFVLALGAAVLASRHPLGSLVLTMCLPVCAVGLSYSDIGEAVVLGLVFVASGVFASALLMLWPETSQAEARPPTPLLAPAFARQYGVLLGLAGATSTLIGILVHTDHIGWAPAAGYFVMRPSAQMQQLRSAGRIVSVCVGALVAVVFVRSNPADGAIAAFGIVAAAAAAGVRTSRWYVTPLFGSAMVLTLLLFEDPAVATVRWRFNERVGETILGVAVAYFFGLVVPRIVAAHRPTLKGSP